MTKYRLHSFTLRAGIVAILGLVASLFGPLGAGFSTNAATAAPLYSVPAVSITVPAGGSASLDVRGISFQPGAIMPHGTLSLSAQSLPNDRVRTALYYGINWGYAETNPQQMALAVWWAQDGTWRSDDHAIAERIADAAASSPGLPTWLVEGRSISNLVAQGQLSLSGLSFTPSAMAPALGIGILTVRNTTAQDILAYLPYGTLFNGSQGAAAVWAVGQSQATQQPPTAPEPPAPPAPPQPQPSPKEDGDYKSAPVAEPPAQTTEPVEPPASDPNESAPPSDPNEGTKSGERTENPANETQSQSPQQEAAPPESAEKNAAEGQQESQAPVESAQPTGDVQAKSPMSNGANGPLPVATDTPIVDTPAEGPNPPPVPTDEAGSQQQPPNPELTKLATVGIAITTPTSGKEDPNDPNNKELTPEEKAKAEAEAKAKAQAEAEARAKAQAEAEAKAKAQSQEQPVPVPNPTPIPEVPEIIINGGTDNQIVIPGGSPPNIAPRTGEGPSSMPVWLTAFSALMMLGGWSLRRMSRAVPVAQE